MKNKNYMATKNKFNIIKIIILLLVIVLIISLVIRRSRVSSTIVKTINQAELTNQVKEPSAETTSSSSSVATSTINKVDLVWPISDAQTRVTKKPFGLYVNPQNSPVKPEKFSGYHTGVDFETKPEEQNIDVPVYAICAGPLVLKKVATGYGGVAVQSCKINNEAVTIIYGHLRFLSITKSVKTVLKLNEQIGVLGYGYSVETSGERKHLHLGIHKGSAVVLLGYVPSQGQLSQWLDFLTLMK